MNIQYLLIQIACLFNISSAPCAKFRIKPVANISISALYNDYGAGVATNLLGLFAKKDLESLWQLFSWKNTSLIGTLIFGSKESSTLRSSWDVLVGMIESYALLTDSTPSETAVRVFSQTVLNILDEMLSDTTWIGSHGGETLATMIKVFVSMLQGFLSGVVMTAEITNMIFGFVV